MTLLWPDDTTDLYDLELCELGYRELVKPPRKKQQPVARKPKGSRLRNVLWIVIALAFGTYFWISFISEMKR